MKVAMITLPEHNILTPSIFRHLHGWWNPPEYVMSFWARGCSIEYISDMDYEIKKEEIKNSYKSCETLFYREFAL